MFEKAKFNADKVIEEGIAAMVRIQAKITGLASVRKSELDAAVDVMLSDIGAIQGQIRDANIHVLTSAQRSQLKDISMDLNGKADILRSYKVVN